MRDRHKMTTGFEKNFISPQIFIQFLVMVFVAMFIWHYTNSYLQIVMAIYWVVLIIYCLKKDWYTNKTKTNAEVTFHYIVFKFRRGADTVASHQDYELLKSSLESKNKERWHEKIIQKVRRNKNGRSRE